MNDHAPIFDLARDLASDAPTKAAFDDDHEQFLADHGLAGLPPDLVGEALSHVADALPPAVASELSPYVARFSPFADPADGAGDDPLAGFRHLALAPVVDLDDPPVFAPGDHTDPGFGMLAGAGLATFGLDSDLDDLDDLAERADPDDGADVDADVDDDAGDLGEDRMADPSPRVEQDQTEPYGVKGDDDLDDLHPAALDTSLKPGGDAGLYDFGDDVRATPVGDDLDDELDHDMRTPAVDLEDDLDDDVSGLAALGIGGDLGLLDHDDAVFFDDDAKPFADDGFDVDGSDPADDLDDLDL